MDIVHLGIKNHVCDTCGKAYVTERELIYHMDTTSKCNKTQQLRCDKCDMGKFAISLTSLKPSPILLHKLPMGNVRARPAELIFTLYHSILPDTLVAAR